MTGNFEMPDSLGDAEDRKIRGGTERALLIKNVLTDADEVDISFTDGRTYATCRTAVLTGGDIMHLAEYGIHLDSALPDGDRLRVQLVMQSEEEGT